MLEIFSERLGFRRGFGGIVGSSGVISEKVGRFCAIGICVRCFPIYVCCVFCGML